MWFKIENNQVRINILAKPNAKKTALLEITNQALCVSIHAKPHQGEANEELIAFLAKLFHVPKSQVILKRGENSRHKQIILPLTDLTQQLIDDPEKFILKCKLIHK